MPGTTRAVFLSYRREETRHVAGRLADRLIERLGSTRVFMDVDTIEPGADFAATTVREVASSDVLVALIGPIWSTITDPQGRRRLDDPDDLVVLEILTALERGIRVIPVLVDGAVMPGRYDLPQGLQALALRNAVRLDHETFRTDVATLLDAVERILAILTPKTAEPMMGTGNRIIARTGIGRDRSASEGIQASYRRWVASLARPTGVDARDGRPPAERDGDGWPRSRRLLAGVIAVVLSGVLVAGLIIRSTSTDGNAPLFTSSTTSLATSPASLVEPGRLLVEPGRLVTLIATITPLVAVGTVQFKDGTTNLGDPVTVSDDGTALMGTSTLSSGSHQLTAVFIPADPAAFGPSTSPPVNVTVTVPG